MLTGIGDYSFSNPNGSCGHHWKTSVANHSEMISEASEPKALSVYFLIKPKLELLHCVTYTQMLLGVNLCIKCTAPAAVHASYSLLSMASLCCSMCTRMNC